MSLILDALRKSERTRQQSLTGQVSAAGMPPARGHLPVPWATLIGILLIANAIVLAVIFWRSHNSAAVPAPVPTHAITAIAPAAAFTPAYHPEIRSLAAEVAAAMNTPPATSASNVAIEPTAVPIKIASPPSPAGMTAAGAVLAPPDNISAFNSLPLSFQQSLPSLHLDVHGYSQSPADRFVIINMQRYQAGDILKEGPKVIQIVSRGVILEYNGTIFLLPRP